jgi:hypothetical protein
VTGSLIKSAGMATLQKPGMSARRRHRAPRFTRKRKRLERCGRVVESDMRLPRHVSRAPRALSARDQSEISCIVCELDVIDGLAVSPAVVGSNAIAPRWEKLRAIYVGAPYVSASLSLNGPRCRETEPPASGQR